jgi:glutamyl-tRNA reductase
MDDIRKRTAIIVGVGDDTSETMARRFAREEFTAVPILNRHAYDSELGAVSILIAAIAVKKP